MSVPRLKAAIRDDAEVDFLQWNRIFQSEARIRAADRIRVWLHNWYRVKLVKEVLSFLKSVKYNPRDVTVCKDAVVRCCRSNWWEWLDGSTLLYWRWPLEFQRRVRDGTPFCRKERIKSWKGKDYSSTASAEDLLLIAKKENKFIYRRYLQPAPNGVAVYIPRFTVPKDTDVRVVWDCTRTGVNDKVFCPRFFLPTTRNLIDATYRHSYSADFDIGEMFHNFHLHIKDQNLFGARIIRDGVETAYRWTRLTMGSKPSPYFSVQTILWGLELIIGDIADVSNPYHYCKVVLNLPGSKDYDPTLPWLMKVRYDGKIACEILIYVDDGRVVGSTYELCWEATRRATSVLNYLGIQDAARKRRFPSQTPGLWSGNLMNSEDEPKQGVSQERWDELRGYLSYLMKLKKVEKAIPRKEFQKIIGKFCHASQKYDYIKPYLKGMYLALYKWIGNKDSDGWPVKDCDTSMDSYAYSNIAGELEDTFLAGSLDGEGDSFFDSNFGSGSSVGAPPTVSFTNLLWEDLQALDKFFSDTKTYMRRIRPDSKMGVVYGFGDASGGGFGSTYTQAGRINYRHGIWASYISEESSNYRELRNLVESIAEECKEGKLKDVQLFLFTDNWVAESAFVKGMSRSQALYDLMLRLRLLEMKYNIWIEIIHVAGRRMISQGTDGLSRGDLNAGVLIGDIMLEHVPLNLSAVERSPGLVKWVNQTFKSPFGKFKFAEPMDWFNDCHKGKKSWIIAPPPPLALLCLEQIAIARHKRPEAMAFVILIPRLMFYSFRRRLHKECNLVHHMPLDDAIWGLTSHFEPLIVAFIIPQRRSQKFPQVWSPSATELEVSEMQKQHWVHSGRRLRKLWTSAWKFLQM